MEKLRGDVHFKIANNSMYLKIGEQIYQIAGLFKEQIQGYWESIVNNDEEKYKTDKNFYQFKSFLQTRGAFKSDCIWDQYLKQYGISDIKNLDAILRSKKVSVVGDDDLVNKFKEESKE